MKRFLIIFLAVIVPGASRAQTVNIPIQNPSFEAPLILDQGPANDPPCAGKYHWGGIPGWINPPHTSSSGAGVVQWGCQSPPDGKNVAMIVNATLSQDVGLPAKGVYKLNFWVANWFYSYHADYKVSFNIGNKEWCALSGEAFGDFLQVTMPCLLPVPDSVMQSGEHLIISFSNTGGWTLLLDNVSLTFTPQS